MHAYLLYNLVHHVWARCRSIEAHHRCQENLESVKRDQVLSGFLVTKS